MTTPTSAGATADAGFAGMSPAQLLYGDLEHELSSTRRVLERVPDGQYDWRPHEKSMSLGRLASHVAELPGFPLAMLRADEMDFATGGYVPAKCATTDELLSVFDGSAAALRAALAEADQAALGRTWTLRMGDQVLVSGQKAGLVRTLGISHIIHHRAQLGVYLRLLGVPVPGLYGPSADEQ